jgi:hypothetical protein
MTCVVHEPSIVIGRSFLLVGPPVCQKRERRMGGSPRDEYRSNISGNGERAGRLCICVGY